MQDHAFVTGEPVADRLLASSSAFAQTAVAAYCQESWDIYHLHLATAVEQVLKAVLAVHHPVLIADAKGFDSVLHLCGLGSYAKTPDFARAVRTITALEALDRVPRFVNEYTPPTALVRLLLEVRNAVVHSAHADRGEAEAVLGDTAQYVAQLLLALKTDERAYWGESSALVAEHAKRTLDAREASYIRRVQAAKERYASLQDQMDEATLKAFILAAAPDLPTDRFDATVATCPACGHDGELWGESQAEWEADWDVSDGEVWSPGAYVSQIDLQATEFHCGVCGLNLGPLHLSFAGLERVTLTPEEYDIDDATRYFGQLYVDEEDYVS